MYVAVSPNVVPVKVLDPLGMVGGLPQGTATDVETCMNMKSGILLNIAIIVKR